MDLFNLVVVQCQAGTWAPLLFYDLKELQRYTNAHNLYSHWLFQYQYEKIPLLTWLWWVTGMYAGDNMVVRFSFLSTSRQGPKPVKYCETNLARM